MVNSERVAVSLTPRWFQPDPDPFDFAHVRIHRLDETKLPLATAVSLTPRWFQPDPDPFDFAHVRIHRLDETKLPLATAVTLTSL
jgi:hypothetical protein